MQHDQLQGNEEAQEKERTQTRLTAPPGSADFLQCHDQRMRKAWQVGVLEPVEEMREWLL